VGEGDRVCAAAMASSAASRKMVIFMYV
jgi:hypothetical protein